MRIGSFLSYILCVYVSTLLPTVRFQTSILVEGGLIFDLSREEPIFSRKFFFEKLSRSNAFEPVHRRVASAPDVKKKDIPSERASGKTKMSR